MVIKTLNFHVLMNMHIKYVLLFLGLFILIILKLDGCQFLKQKMRI